MLGKKTEKFLSTIECNPHMGIAIFEGRSFKRCSNNRDFRKLVRDICQMHFEEQESEIKDVCQEALDYFEGLQVDEIDDKEESAVRVAEKLRKILRR